MLSRNHELTKLIVLRCHEKVYHNGVKQTLSELQADFWINRGRSYVRKLTVVVFVNVFNPEVTIMQKTQIYYRIEMLQYHFKFVEYIIWDHCTIVRKRYLS